MRISFASNIGGESRPRPEAITLLPVGTGLCAYKSINVLFCEAES